MNDRFEQIGKTVLVSAFLFGCFGHGCETKTTVEYEPPRRLTTYQELHIAVLTRQAIALERIADYLEAKEDLLDGVMDLAPEEARRVIQTRLSTVESRLMMAYWEGWLEVNDD